ncbi:Uncharacterised protein [Enterobacter cloacae]|nr:Uncharacterised protein [Enterobacter cloacae]
MTNGSSFRNKSWQLAVIDPLLLVNARRQQFITLWRKASHQFSQKLYRFCRQNLLFLLTIRLGKGQFIDRCCLLSHRSAPHQRSKSRPRRERKIVV